MKTHHIIFVLLLPLWLVACESEDAANLIIKDLTVEPKPVEKHFSISWTTDYNQIIDYYDLYFYLSDDSLISANDTEIGTVSCARPEDLFLCDKNGITYFVYDKPFIKMDVNNDSVFTTPVEVGTLDGNYYVIGEAISTVKESYDTIRAEAVAAIEFK